MRTRRGMGNSGPSGKSARRSRVSSNGPSAKFPRGCPEAESGHVACSQGRIDGGPYVRLLQGVVHDPLDRRSVGRLCPHLVRRPGRGGRQGRGQGSSQGRGQGREEGREEGTQEGGEGREEGREG